jgi:hypothetical protein
VAGRTKTTDSLEEIEFLKAVGVDLSGIVGSVGRLDRGSDDLSRDSNLRLSRDGGDSLNLSGGGRSLNLSSGRRCKSTSASGTPDVADTSRAIVDSVLHVASTPDPRDSLALLVGVASVDALLEGAAHGVKVGTGVVVTALDCEVAADVGVVLVVDAGQSRGNLGGRNNRGGSGTGTLCGPDTGVVAKVAKGLLEVAPAVVESAQFC